MAELQKKDSPKKEKKGISKGITILVTILTILVIVQGVKIFLDYQEEMVLEQQLKDEEKELASTLQQLSDIRNELEESIAQIEELGGNIEELEAAKAEIETELASTRRTNRNTINRLQGKVSGYEELLVQKDNEIERLKALSEQLYTENTDLKSERNQLNRTITELNQSKSELENKVEIASELRAENVGVIAISSRGRERTSPFRSRQVNQLKVVFNIAKNDVAPIEGKDIMIRIMDPQNNVIFDVTKGSGTFMLNEKEEFYTAKQEILFDNSMQQLTFIYNKGTDYESGNYAVEIYADNYLMGVGEFIVQ